MRREELQSVDSLQRSLIVLSRLDRVEEVKIHSGPRERVSRKWQEKFRREDDRASALLGFCARIKSFRSS